MECKVAIVKIHEYLDGELSRDESEKLKAHMEVCSACKSRFEQLEKVDAAMYHAFEAAKPTVHYNANALTARIMQQVPKSPSKKKKGIVRLLYRYPGITAAAIFLLVMFGSFAASWQQDAKLMISVEDVQKLVVDGKTVIVPEGVHVTGDLIVENGSIEVFGEVEGNVTVIDGKMVLASTGHIAGQSKIIDEALGWFWYKVTSAFGGMSK